VVYSDALGRNIDSANDPDGRNPINAIVATAPDAYKVHVPGHHLNVTDLPLISPVLTSLIIRAAPGNGRAAAIQRGGGRHTRRAAVGWPPSSRAAWRT